MVLEKKLPVQKTDFNLIDTEFNSIRSRFEAEMKKMEEEMNNFRSQLQDRERSFFESSQTSHQKTMTSHSTKSGSDGTKHRSEFNTWLDEIKSPLVQDSDDGKVLRLKFDVTQYSPEEIVVKTVDNRLQVHAKHEEKTDTRSISREYSRDFLLPRGVNPELIRSSLTKDGVLIVEAPLPALESSGPERKIPIEHR